MTKAAAVAAALERPLATTLPLDAVGSSRTDTTTGLSSPPQLTHLSSELSSSDSSDNDHQGVRKSVPTFSFSRHLSTCPLPCMLLVLCIKRGFFPHSAGVFFLVHPCVSIAVEHQSTLPCSV